jgi:hypothetical protein
MALFGPIVIIPCEGARDEPSEAALAEPFKKRGRWLPVTRLHRHKAGDYATVCAITISGVERSA